MKFRLFLSIIVSAFACVLCACNEKKDVKLAVFDASLGERYRTSVAAFDKAKELGLDGVQVSRNYAAGKPYLTKEQIVALKQKSEETGLKIPSIVVGGLPVVGNPGAPEYIKAAIDAAKALGAKNVLVSFFGRDKLSDDNCKLVEAKFAPLVAQLKLVMPYAEKNGVQICMENTLSSDENNRVIDAVGSPNLKVYFDSFNIVYYGHEEVSSIEKLKGRIGEVHLKDKGHKLGSSKEMPKDFSACMAALKRIGYDGWYCFETHRFNYKKDDIADTLKYNIKLTKELAK